MKKKVGKTERKKIISPEIFFMSFHFWLFFFFYSEVFCYSNYLCLYVWMQWMYWEAYYFPLSQLWKIPSVFFLRRNPKKRKIFTRKIYLLYIALFFFSSSEFVFNLRKNCFSSSIFLHFFLISVCIIILSFYTGLNMRWYFCRMSQDFHCLCSLYTIFSMFLRIWCQMKKKMYSRYMKKFLFCIVFSTMNRL